MESNLFPEHQADGLIIPLSSDFDYDLSDPDSVKNPFGAQRLSKLNRTTACPSNIYFDMEFNQDNLSYVKNAKYITFDRSIKATPDLITYLQTCSHYHIGFDAKHSKINGTDIVLSDSIRSLLIGGAEYILSNKIVSANLEYLFLATYETFGKSHYDLTQLPNLKHLMLDGLSISQLKFSGRLILLAGGEQKIRSMDYPDNLKELVIVPESDDKIFVVEAHSRYRDIIKIFKPVEFECECEIKFVESDCVCVACDYCQSVSKK